MNHRTPVLPRLLVPALLAAGLSGATPARAAPPQGFIRSDEVRPRVEAMLKKAQEARMGQRRQEDVVAEYAGQATDEKAAPRERAISLFLYGQLLALIPRNDDAVAAWRQALATYAQFPDAHVALGRMALSKGDFKSAGKHAKAAVDIHASHLHAFVLRADIAEAQDDLAEAEHWFGRAVEEDPTQPMALQGLALTRVKRFKASYNEERKKQFSDGARRVADTWVSMNPDEAYPRVFQAQVYYALGLRDQAAQKLEATLTGVRDLSDRDRQVCLERLFYVHAEQGDVEGAKGALARIVKLKSLPADEREHFAQRLSELENQGLNAFLKWQVDMQIEIMSNRGHSPTQRREAMRRLHELLSEPRFLSDEKLAPVINEAWRACVRTLSPPTPPELAIDMLQFFRRNLRDPKIIRIVVHFLYPQSVDSGVTENVRVEATRTVADLGKLAAVPTLLYTLNDDSRAVTRAIDVKLCSLLERRSMIAPGAGPVTEEEQKKLRLGWIEWTHSASGNEALAKALGVLHEMTAKDQRFNRKQQRNPLADHVIRVVLLDNDVGWEAWEAGYLFLRDFLGRDFLPPEKRGKVVTEELRPVLRAEIEKWYRGDTVTQEEAEQANGEKSSDGGDEKDK